MESRGSGSARGTGRGGTRSGSNNRDTQVSMLQAEVESGTDVKATEPELESEHGVTLPKDINEEMATDCNSNVIEEAISHVMATMVTRPAETRRNSVPPQLQRCFLMMFPLELCWTLDPQQVLSPEFFLRAAATRRTQEQTTADWGKASDCILRPFPRVAMVQ